MDVQLATTERKSFLPLRLRSTSVIGSSNKRVVSHLTTPVSTPMQTSTSNDRESSLNMRDRVLVNGLKSGTIRYLGRVQFAQGLFCGIELDEPDGKHDGQVDNVRYFQCKSNCGIFVPNDKVILVPRQRASSIQRTVSRLKPPGIKRSLTISSSVPRIASVSSQSKPIQLPDIIPSSSTPQTVPAIETSPSKNQEVPVSKETKMITIPSQPSTIVEPLETIEADFTDSVFLILHQLQQEPQCSVTISEEGTIDDDDDEDIDGSDSESIIESINDEPKQINRILSSSIGLANETTRFVQTDLSCNINETLTIVKPNLLNIKSNKLLSGSSTLVNKLKQNPPDSRINQKKTTTTKDFDRRPSIPLTTSRKSLLIPPKPIVSSVTKLHSASLANSRTKLNSSSNSLNHSQLDITSTHPSKTVTTPVRVLSHPMDLSSDKQINVPRANLDQQLLLQKLNIQSLEMTHERVKQQYQHLLKQFELMYHLSQYYITENEQIQQQHKLKLCQNRTAFYRLKTTIEELRISHQHDLNTREQDYRAELDRNNAVHHQQSLEYQQQIEQFLNDKHDLETRCSSLQERVDSFQAEMANSEHADLLLCHVDTLEKDRLSLQTVLDMKNHELTQLRTKMNEQVFHREDQFALQKRIDMAENRNQDLVCLLKQWQLQEIAVVVERDQLKEQVAQLERDNRQLTFENEILFYRVRQQSSSISSPIASQSNSLSPSTADQRHRTSSISSPLAMTHHNERIKRSVSLNSISDR